MSDSKKNTPIPLAGMQGGGCTANGEYLHLTFEAHDGDLYTFSVPHEAAGEIVTSILAIAELAEKQRADASQFTPGEVQSFGRVFPLQRYEISLMPESGAAALKLLFRKGLELTVTLQREDARKLAEDLGTAVARMSN